VIFQATKESPLLLADFSSLDGTSLAVK